MGEEEREAVREETESPKGYVCVCYERDPNAGSPDSCNGLYSVASPPTSDTSESGRERREG